MTRPFVGAAKGLLSYVLEPMTWTVEDSVEAQSTEELLRNINETNESLGDIRLEEVAVGSMDVTALYLSIYQRLSARLVKEEYIESDFEVEDIHGKAGYLYLALNISRQELVREGIVHLFVRK